MNLIVDASVAFKLLVTEDGSDIALRLLAEHDFLAPDLILAECRNAILTCVRRGRATLDLARQLEKNLDALDIPVLPSRPLLPQAFTIALECSHPIYDCIYVAAALSNDRVFVTADARLANKLANSTSARDRVKLLKSFAAGS